MRYQRVTLKLSGEAVSGDDDFGFDPDALEHIADEVLGMHASGELVYARNPQWTHFVATVGLDDAQRSDPRASILCQVIVEDAAGKKQVLAKSPTLKSGKQVQHNFDVALPAGCVKIHLVVNDAGDGIHCDHANWVNAGFLGGKARYKPDNRLAVP